MVQMRISLLNGLHLPGGSVYHLQFTIVLILLASTFTRRYGYILVFFIIMVHYASKLEFIGVHIHHSGPI